MNEAAEMDQVKVGERLLVTVDQAAEILGVGRTTIYELLADGDIRTVLIRRCRRIPTAELRAFVERLCDEEARNA